MLLCNLDLSRSKELPKKHIEEGNL